VRFFCRTCKEYNDLDLVVKGSISIIDESSKCKPCHNEYKRNIEMLNRVDKNPQNYFQCNDCDQYMYKFTSTGNTLNDWIKTRHTNCKHCNGTNLENIE